MFQPGVSGNPSGRPKSDVSIREMAREFTTQALQILIEVAANPKAPHSARVHAACALLDRGWGKPAQYIESVSLEPTLQDFLQMIAEQDAADAASGRVSHAVQICHVVDAFGRELNSDASTSSLGAIDCSPNPNLGTCANGTPPPFA